METVVTAVIIIFVVLFAVLMLSHAFLSAQDVLRVSWEEMAARADDQSRTLLSFVNGHTANNGALVEVTLRNDGATRLTDFSHWDLLVEYYDGSTPAGYHVGWMPYASPSTANQWTVKGIYLNAEKQAPEAFEPGILNPGEEMIIDFNASPAVAPGAGVQVSVAPLNGKGTSTTFAGNFLPKLVNNVGLIVNSGESGVIGSDLLKTTDDDDAAANLTYTVTTPPAQGALNLGANFTQADVDRGALSYSHTGGGNDTFQFTVSDGKDTIGSYTFQITVNEPPEMPVNTGLNVPANGTAALGDLLLKAADSDNAPSELVYTVTVPPTKGVLSMGTRFTQADIDAGSVSYTHMGGGTDSFKFTVSDGRATIGPFTFTITPY